MSRFSVLEAGFNRNDETINFGTRATASDQTLYEISTLATIRSEETTQTAPNSVEVNSCTYKGRIFFSINKILRILKDKEISKEPFCLEFNYNIDCFSVFEDFLLICTRDGQLKILKISLIFQEYDSHIDSNFEPVFTEKFDGDFYGKFFISCSLDYSNSCFYVTTSYGLIKKIQMSGNNTFMSEVIIDLQRKVNICAFGNSHILLEGHELIIVDISEKTYDVGQAIGLKFVHFLGVNYFAYDETGNINMITPNLLVFCINNQFPDIVNHFKCLMLINDTQEEDKHHLIGVTKDNLEKSHIELFSFPDMAKIYSIELDHPIHLVQMQNSNEEVLFFSEIIKNTFIDEIRLQYIYEADPELRIKRLIQKQLFDEAERFAKTYNIDMGIILEAKAQHIVNKLSCKTSDIDELFNIFSQIDDHLFKLNCCDIIECELGYDARRILYYAAFMDIDVRDSNKNKDNPVLHMKTLFNRKLHRFDTYIQVYENYRYQKWNYFMQCDLIDEVKTFLKNGNVEESIIIFNRLDFDSMFSLTDEKVEELLYIINQSRKDMTAFLTAFIPITLKFRPEALGIFVEWLHGRIYQLEKQFSYDFPECGIKFVEDVTKLMNLNLPMRKQFDIEDSLSKLGYLLTALKDIQILQENFGINLHVSDYLTDPNKTVKILFSTNMDSKDFETFIKEFLCPFILRNDLDKDYLFLLEIKNLIHFTEEYWINLVLILLRFMDSTEKKVEAIKYIADYAAIPWSDQVRDIFKMIYTFKTSNPMAQEVSNLLKEEDKMNIARKYGIKWKQFADSQDKLFYYNRIFYLKGIEGVEDIRTLYNNDDDRNLNEYHMVVKLIRKEKYSEAMAILDGNTPDTIYFVAERILSYVLSSMKLSPNKERGFFHNALSMIHARLSKYAKNEADKKQAEFDYNVAKAIYGIEETFGIKTQYSDFFARSKRLFLLYRLTRQVLETSTDEWDFDYLLTMSKKISLFMNEPVDNVLLRFLRNIDYNIVLKLAEYVLASSTNSHNLTLCAIYLFKFLKSDYNDNGDDTFLDALVNVHNKDEDYLSGVCLARDLMIKAVINASPDNHLAVMEVFRWINSCYFITDLRKQYVAEDAHHIYIPKYTGYPFVSQLEAIKTIFNAYCDYIGYVGHPNLRYLTQFSTNIHIDQTQLNNEVKQFTWNLNTFLKEDQHLTAYNMIRTLQHSLLYDPYIKKETILFLSSYLYKTWLPQTIDVVLSHKIIDKSLFFNLMLMLGPNFDSYIQKYLQIYKKRTTKLVIIAQVGLELLRYYNNDYNEGKEDLVNILNMCKWWNKLRGIDMNYVMFFTSSSANRLKELITNKQIDLKNIEEYCSDFGLDLQYSYIEYLKTLLQNWEPEVEYVTDVYGKKSILIKNDESSLIQSCLAVVKFIKDKTEVCKLAERIWPVINFYYYEVYIALLSIQSYLGNIKSSFHLYRPLLSFLKTYTRVSVPSRSEVEQWYGAFPCKAFIDPLSEFRLPLTNIFLSNEIWSIIKPEVNLQTYKQWFKVANILGEYLNNHDICIYAINSVLSTQVVDNSCKDWELYPKYEHLVKQVDECAKHISDFERATAVVYTLMCGMPPGVDKVNFAELSYKYAQVYRQSSTKDVDKIYNKVKQRYFNYSAMHILYKYGLTNPKYLNLVAQPNALIAELYTDPRIVNQVDSIDFYCPDINKAVDELCNLFNLTGKKVRYDLLSDLLKSNVLVDLDSTVFKPATPQFADNSEANCLKRACYICSGPDIHIWRKTLLKNGINKDNLELSMTFRANALKCFHCITDVETMESMTGMSYIEFMDYVDKIIVIAQMGDLGVCFENVQQLDEMNKKKILKKLTQIGGHIAVKCIASICMIYHLDDLKYWEFIVNTAIQYNMIKELVEYVEYLKFRCVTDFVKKAWHVILVDAFSSVKTDIGTEKSQEETREAYIKALRLLQTCPVIYALDFDVYIQTCFSNNQQLFAVVLLQYLPEDTMKNYTKNITDKSKLFEQLQKLRQEGITGINKVIGILHNHF
ncbi:kinetochore component rough deal [Rhynchophorus ferrugineus]|uniref:kinetochore component rough deal n=1 Tax=Rhynchophorus ferrugineus TaxID=354439 RepID=UPI003FCD1483